jgi:hypothetical protein
MSTLINEDQYNDYELHVNETEDWQPLTSPTTSTSSPPSPRDTTEASPSLHSDTSADVDLLSALKYDVPDNHQDFHIETEVGDIEVHSVTHNNPITGSNCLEDELLPPTIRQSSFKLKKGYTLHTVYTVWGQIDQLCLRQQRLLRLVVLVNMLQQTALTAQDLHIVYKKYSGLKKHLAQIFNDQSKLRLSQQSTLRRRWNKGQYEPF